MTKYLYFDRAALFRVDPSRSSAAFWRRRVIRRGSTDFVIVCIKSEFCWLRSLWKRGTVAVIVLSLVTLPMRRYAPWTLCWRASHEIVCLLGTMTLDGRGRIRLRRWYLTAWHILLKAFDISGKTLPVDSLKLKSSVTYSTSVNTLSVVECLALNHVSVSERH